MKKTSISATTIVLVLVLLALVLYCFLYFIPAQSEMTLLRTETNLFNAEASVYQKYLSDSTPLENEIEAIQAEIDRMNAEDYVNDSTVSFEIGDAIQRFGVSLSSVSLSDATTFENYRVLPINLTLSGQLDDILKFIEHFENNEAGSYLVRGVSIEVSGNTTDASLLIFLCTPNL